MSLFAPSLQRAARWSSIAAAATAMLATGASGSHASGSMTTAATGGGHVTLSIGGKGRAVEALAAAGVRPRAIAPAAKRGRLVRLPVRSLFVGRIATASLRGGVRFAAGPRSLRLRSLRLRLAPRRATLTAVAGKRRITVFSATPRAAAEIDASTATATLGGARLRLTTGAARLLRAKLDLPGVVAGPLGRLAVDAGPRRRAVGAPTPGGQGGQGGGLAPVAPRSGPIATEPPRLTRPPGAVDVATATLRWRPRESWIQYVNGGEGTSVSGGAANGPQEVRPGSSVPLVYSFTSFPFANGWYDSASGKAAIYFRGGVGFRHGAHGIDFSSSDPEVEINGVRSRAIFRFDGADGTPFDGQRGVLVDLHPGAVQAPAGGTVTYADVPGTIPADAGQSVFAGFYAAGEPFGTLTVSFTTP
ncbi:MAG TPA: HtaA domain-containing protein [Thermoleophilaceae bacterium]|nr:HtaA domain-containing protein [Thermoleophilaceae bacterium]